MKVSVMEMDKKKKKQRRKEILKKNKEMKEKMKER